MISVITPAYNEDLFIKKKGVRSALDSLENIIEKKAQGQTPDSEFIWILFLIRHGKKLNITS